MTQRAMTQRKWGLVLLVVGVVGLGLTSWGWAAEPGEGPRWGAGWGSGWMGSMHAWMHGDGAAYAGRAEAPEPSPGAEEVVVAARDFSFSPVEIRVEAGRTVNLALENRGNLPHDITIPDLGFRLLAGPRQTVRASLTARTPGTYGFFCSVPGHREAGMSGTLVVS